MNLSIIQRAFFLYQEGQYEQAWQLFGKLSQAELINFSVVGQVADCAYRTNRLDIAKDLYRWALRQNCTTPHYYFNLALIYFRYQDWSACLENLYQVKKLKPDHTRAADLIIQALAMRGQSQDIEQLNELLQQRLAKDPLDQHALRIWAEVYWLQESADWCKYYEAALALSNHETVFIDYMQKLVAMHLYEKAENVLSTYPGLKQSQAFQYASAMVEYEKGNPKKALSYINKLNSNWLNNRVIDELHVRTLIMSGEREKALHLARKRLESTAASQGDWALLATALKHCGNQHEYRWLYNYDAFVKAFKVKCPAGYQDIGSFHDALIQKLDVLHIDRNHPLDQSLRLGSQTKGHLFLLDIEEVKLLESLIREKLLNYIEGLEDNADHPFLARKSKHIRFTGAWSVKLRQQGFHRNHFHNEGWISGCYYLQIPQVINQRGQGWIKFGQNESATIIDSAADYMVRPEPGLVVFFPSYMWHGTEEFIDDEPRITVAFDLIPD